jgi:hypothetical protein
MTNTLVLEKERFGYKRKKQNRNSFGNELKRMANDSLFYFAIFLAAFFVMQYVPVISGLTKDLTIGVNEVAVSLLGFVNVFFVQIYNKKLKKN